MSTDVIGALVAMALAGAVLLAIAGVTAAVRELERSRDAIELDVKGR